MPCLLVVSACQRQGGAYRASTASDPDLERSLPPLVAVSGLRLLLAVRAAARPPASDPDPRPFRRLAARAVLALSPSVVSTALVLSVVPPRVFFCFPPFKAFEPSGLERPAGILGVLLLPTWRPPWPPESILCCITGVRGAGEAAGFAAPGFALFLSGLSPLGDLVTKGALSGVPLLSRVRVFFVVPALDPPCPDGVR